jgi:hypothetical protein
MAHGGGHGGHYGHHGGYGSGFSPIYPLLFYPMMGYWLLRQNYAPLSQQDPFVDFTAKLSFNLQTSYSGLITEQTVIQEDITTAQFAETLASFMRKCGFQRLISITADGAEIFRRDLDPKEQVSIPEDNLDETFALLKKSSDIRSISIVGYSTAGNFRSTLNVSFASRHYADRYSVECFLSAVPQVYFRKQTESEQGAAARISRFSAMMANSFDRSAFVIQERDFLVPVLQNLASLFASTFKVKNGMMQLFEGRSPAPIWRSAVPSKT